MPADPTRRHVLGAGLASLGLAGLPRLARGLGSTSLVDVAEIQLPSGTTSRPQAWHRLLFEVMQSTSVECEPRTVQVAPEDPELFAHPFSVLLGTGELPELSEAAVAQLVRYLSYGGFLLIDDTTSSPGGPFELSVRRLCARMFPTRMLSPLQKNHSLYRSFFLLDRPVGRTDVTGVLEGITMDKVTPLVSCGMDLSGALARGPDGRDLYPVVPGGNRQRREALKLGINMVLYSLTSNYKHDQAHVLELIREGRIE
ncbi:MAG: DUF4159 domain-containing protein [Myxococcota bacterium]|jgi:hypothetical protein|nr:DUF4159 domain-containing protein [Myxococcota bacterium]